MRTDRTAMFRRSFGLISGPVRALLPAALLGISGLAAPPAAAAKPQRFSVDVQAPDGKGCITGEKLADAVQKHTRGPAKPEKVDVQIEAAGQGTGWVADVTVKGRPGTRRVKTPSASCSKLDQGLVLVVTMLVDPDDEEPPPPPKKADKGDQESPGDADEPAPGSGWGDEPADELPADDDAEPQKKPGAPKGDSPNKPEPEGGSLGNHGKKGEPGCSDKGSPDKGSPKKGSPDEDADKADDAEESAKGAGKGKKKAPPKEKVQFGLTAEAVYATGLVPAGVPGVRVALSWMAPTPVGIEAAFSYYAPVEEWQWSGQNNAIRHVEAMAFELNACPAKVDAGRLHFGACAGVTVNRYQHWASASGPDIDQAQDPYYWGYGTSEAWSVAPSADLRFGVSLFSALRVGATVSAQVPVSQGGGQAWGGDPMFAFGPLYEPVIFQARAGITVVLPP